MGESSSSEMELKTIEINKEYLRKLYMNPAFSDATLVVEGKEFPVIRHFLSMRSTFFESLFNGNFEDGRKNKLELQEVKLESFEILMRYVYTGDIELESTEKENLFDLLNLAHFFGMPAALQKIEDLVAELPIVEANVVEFVNIAALLGLEKLLKRQFQYIFSHQNEFTQKGVFLTFNEAALLKLLDSDEWTLMEIKIAQNVEDWLNMNLTTNREEVLNKIQLHLIDARILVEEIRPKNLFTDDVIIEALQKRTYQPYKNSRKMLVTPIEIKERFGRNNQRTLKRFEINTTSPIIQKIEVKISQPIDANTLLLISGTDKQTAYKIV